MKNTDNFHNTKEAIMCYHQINIFHRQQDEWDTKEDTGKSLKNSLYVQPKNTSQAEVTLNSENQAHNLSYHGVTLVWQAGSQAIS